MTYWEVIYVRRFYWSDSILGPKKEDEQVKILIDILADLCGIMTVNCLRVFSSSTLISEGLKQASFTSFQLIELQH